MRKAVSLPKRSFGKPDERFKSPMKTNQPSFFFLYSFEIKNEFNILTKKRGGGSGVGKEDMNPVLIQYDARPMLQASVEQRSAALAEDLKWSEGSYLLCWPT